jgi:hypothetical protein
LTLNEPQSSRKQFEVAFLGARWQVRDLKSRNGTFLNDERLGEEPLPLVHGDQIRVGETVVDFDAQVPTLAEGMELGNVILGAPCGRTKYGLLYSGRQPSLDRDVTVEVLDPDQAADPQARERYQQRARSAGAFEHSGIVAVFDVAATERAVYTVFESFPPQTLAARLQAGRPLSRADGLTLLRLTAEALHHVHSRERVHGSLTPRAIRLEGDSKAKLSGLGEPPGSRLSAFRQDAHAFAAYASPEEARGEEPGSASDMYALGLIACHVLGGGLPVQGRKREVLDVHASSDPLDLSGLALDDELVSGLAPLLAKSADGRPTAREAAGLFLELGGGGALSASSAIRRQKAAKKPFGSGSPKQGSARQAKQGSAREAKQGSARQAKQGSAREAKQGSARQAKQGSARQAKQGSARQARQSSARQGLAKKGSSGRIAPRRVSDRAYGPEPAWALPARIGLLSLGYGLIFSGAFLVARIAMRLIG